MLTFLAFQLESFLHTFGKNCSYHQSNPTDKISAQLLFLANGQAKYLAYARYVIIHKGDNKISHSLQATNNRIWHQQSSRIIWVISWSAPRSRKWTSVSLCCKYKLRRCTVTVIYAAVIHEAARRSLRTIILACFIHITMVSGVTACGVVRSKMIRSVGCTVRDTIVSSV